MSVTFYTTNHFWHHYLLRGGAYGYGEGGWVFSAALAHTSLPSYRERISRRMNIE